MMEFTQFKKVVQQHFDKMKELDLFRVEVDKDLLWETYLTSFPEGTNPTFRERTEHDCSCCRSFVKNAGGMVAIKDGELISIWDVEIGDRYQPVADALSALVKSKAIDNVFVHSERVIGVDKNYEQGETVLTWEHFYIKLPDNLFLRGDRIGSTLSDYRATHDVMHRGLSEITLDAIDTVLELIGQNSLYRGEENRHAVDGFLKLKNAFDKAENEDLFCWEKVKSVPHSVSRIRNTAIGTLLVDLSDGVELDRAVTSFEQKVAPANYKRPSALVTKAMIAKAKETVEDLGLTSALDRRFATLEDISINNVMFADRSAKQRMNDVFDEVSAQVPDKVKNLDKVEEIPIERFIEEVLPKADQIEVMVENRHNANFVSLVAPENSEAKQLFKWDNPFSWSYQGEMADSIKERVKAAGGNVTGDLRCSLSWFNYDDLDLHMHEPGPRGGINGGHHIYYSQKVSRDTGGNLDVDMNAGGRSSREPVENICYPDRHKMRNGIYRLAVHQYSKRESDNVGFDIEIEFDGQLYSISYPKAVRQGATVEVAKIQHTDGEFKIIESLPSSQTPRTVWGVRTQNFQKVQTVMLSPNHWNGRPVGNKHYFFFLESCQNDGRVRGFFNEFLLPDLDQHRKVLEIVGSKVRVEDSENQLSGLGFSSTKRNYLIARVKGSFQRDLKVTF